MASTSAPHLRVLAKSRKGPPTDEKWPGAICAALLLGSIGATWGLIWYVAASWQAWAAS